LSTEQTTRVIASRLDEHEIRRLDELARQQSRTRSQQIAHMLRRALREDAKP